MRLLASIVVFILWLLLGWKMCSDYSRCCPDGSSSPSSLPVGAPEEVDNGLDCLSGVVCFMENECIPSFNAEFQNYRDSIVGLLAEGGVLEITGLYSTVENFADDNQNLGECRANAIRAAFANLTESQVEVKELAVIGRELANHERVRFQIMKAPTSDIDIEAVIYFPFNSTNKLNDREIEQYLNEVAERVKNSGEKIRLTGHTDSEGSESANLRLGQRRANQIADYLLGQGVLRSQIESLSKGESAPVASNKTEVGRARNRRTELQIIQ